MPLVYEVQETSRCCYQDIDAFAKGLDLGLLGYAAKNDEIFHTRVSAIGGEAIPDLDRELAGGGKDQCFYRPVSAKARFGCDAGGIFAKKLQHGNGKGGRLAGTCLGAAQKIFSAKDNGYGLCLDRGGSCIALLLYSL